MFSNFISWLGGLFLRDFFSDLISRNAKEYGLINSKLDNLSQRIVTGFPDRKVLRHIIGSIDLKDVQEEETMTENEREQYCATISAVYPRLEKDIKRFIFTQLEFLALQSENWEQAMISRGTINGFDLLLNHWKAAHQEHQEKLIPKEKPDNAKPFAEI